MYAGHAEAPHCYAGSLIGGQRQLGLSRDGRPCSAFCPDEERDSLMFWDEELVVWSIGCFLLKFGGDFFLINDGLF